MCAYILIGIRHLLVAKLQAPGHSSTKGVESEERVPPHSSPHTLEYLGSGVSGGMAGSLASIVSRMFTCYRSFFVPVIVYNY